MQRKALFGASRALWMFLKSEAPLRLVSWYILLSAHPGPPTHTHVPDAEIFNELPHLLAKSHHGVTNGVMSL